MSISYHDKRYHPAMIFLHWLIFILFVAMYVIIKAREYIVETDPLHLQLILLHKSLGILIFFLVICRLLIKWATLRPPIIPAQNQLGKKLTVLGHIILYLVMLAMPLSGYIMSVTAGYPVSFFNMQLPSLMGLNEELGNNAYATHTFIATAIYFLVGLHIFFALWHHFVRQDNTLIRMKPGKN